MALETVTILLTPTWVLLSANNTSLLKYETGDRVLVYAGAAQPAASAEVGLTDGKATLTALGDAKVYARALDASAKIRVTRTVDAGNPAVIEAKPLTISISSTTTASTDGTVAAAITGLVAGSTLSLNFVTRNRFAIVRTGDTTANIVRTAAGISARDHEIEFVQMVPGAANSPQRVNLALPVTTPAPVVVAPSLIRGATKVGGSASVSASFAGKTQSLMVKQRRPFTRARMKVYGVGASNGIKAAIGASVNTASLTVPSGGIGAFAPLVFQTPSHPAADTGSGSSLVPKIAYSDWVDISTVARNDGGPGFLFLGRLYEDATSDGNRVAMATTAPANAADFENYGWYAAYCSTNGDFTMSAATFAGNASGPPFMLEFETATAGKTVAWVGDSTEEGRDVSGLRTHCAARLAIDALNAEGKTIDYVNVGWSGATTAGATGTPPATVSGYWAQMLALFAAMAKLPDIVCFKPTSVNNSYSLWNVADTQYWCDQFLAWATANGVTPVLVTPTPLNGYNAATESNRQAAVAAIIAKANAAAVAYVDRSAALTAAGSTGGYGDNSWTSDGTHQSLAGAIIERDYPVRGWKAVLGAVT